MELNQEYVHIETEIKKENKLNDKLSDETQFWK